MVLSLLMLHNTTLTQLKLSAPSCLLVLLLVLHSLLFTSFFLSSSTSRSVLVCHTEVTDGQNARFHTIVESLTPSTAADA